MTGHTLADIHPQPSGWYARCDCGVIVHGYDRANATTAFLEHAEAQHLVHIEQDPA